MSARPARLGRRRQRASSLSRASPRAVRVRIGLVSSTQLAADRHDADGRIVDDPAQIRRGGDADANRSSAAPAPSRGGMETTIASAFSSARPSPGRRGRRRTRKPRRLEREAPRCAPPCGRSARLDGRHVPDQRFGAIADAKEEDFHSLKPKRTAVRDDVTRKLLLSVPRRAGLLAQERIARAGQIRPARLHAERLAGRLHPGALVDLAAGGAERVAIENLA